MNTVTLYNAGNITGMTPEQLEEMHIDFAQYDIVRRVERWSIREFMRENAPYLTGRVLDYGAGTQPYRELVKGEYFPWSPGHAYPVGKFNAVVCNQVMQYVDNPYASLTNMFDTLASGGCLVLTFPTNWDEVEDNDLWRFTAKGMAKVLSETGFDVLKMEKRAQVAHGNFKFPLGYGCVARKA